MRGLVFGLMALAGVASAPAHAAPHAVPLLGLNSAPLIVPVQYYEDWRYREWRRREAFEHWRRHEQRERWRRHEWREHRGW